MVQYITFRITDYSNPLPISERMSMTRDPETHRSVQDRRPCMHNMLPICREITAVTPLIQPLAVLAIPTIALTKPFGFRRGSTRLPTGCIEPT